jgi:hypothetical protein
MNPPRSRLALLPALLALAAAPAAVAAPLKPHVHHEDSDIAPSEARQTVLDLAAGLSHPSEPPPISAGLKTPFDFDKPAPDDPVPAPNGGAPIPSAPAQKTPRDILEAVASLIKPKGTFTLGGQTYLTFGQRKLKVGDKFTITFEGNDYELTLVAIERISFTLRYQSEETTRPIH